MLHRIKSPYVHHPIGRRGASLLIFGFIPFSIGGVHFASGGSGGGIPVLSAILPPVVWSTAWMILGLVAMTSAFGTEAAKRFGYVIAYSVPALWVAALLASWAYGLAPTGWIVAIVYLGYCLLVFVIAGWEESSTDIIAANREGQPWT